MSNLTIAILEVFPNANVFDVGRDRVSVETPTSVFLLERTVPPLNLYRLTVYGSLRVFETSGMEPFTLLDALNAIREETRQGLMASAQ